MVSRLLACSVLFLILGCRTAGEPDRALVPPIALTPAIDPSAPILKKVTGRLTEKYPDNRKEECVILTSDVPNSGEVLAAITRLKAQDLAEGFIFRQQIPSLQFFGILGGEEVLLQSITDEKMQYRQPVGEIGNPSLNLIMAIFFEKCGVDDAKP